VFHNGRRACHYCLWVEVWERPRIGDTTWTWYSFRSRPYESWKTQWHRSSVETNVVLGTTTMTTMMQWPRWMVSLDWPSRVAVVPLVVVVVARNCFHLDAVAVGRLAFGNSRLVLEWGYFPGGVMVVVVVPWNTSLTVILVGRIMALIAAVLLPHIAITGITLIIMMRRILVPATFAMIAILVIVVSG
jgi:hypothetical protein